MNILVTGSNGFIGSHLIKRLSDDSEFIINALVRSNSSTSKTDGINYIVGDLLQLHSWEKNLKNIDIVVHVAGLAHVMDNFADSREQFRNQNTSATIDFAKICLSYSVKRFIYISSIKVLGEYTEIGVPFSHKSNENPIDPYAISKYEAELGLRLISKENKMEIVIIRPPLVYGPSVKGNFQRLIKLISTELPLPLSGIKNKRSMISIYNLVDLIMVCLNHPNASNKIFLVSDDNDLSTSDLLRFLSLSGGYRSRLFKVPSEFLRFSLMLLGKKNIYERLFKSMQVDISYTKNQLSWQPPYDLMDSLLKSWLPGTRKKHKE